MERVWTLPTDPTTDLSGDRIECKQIPDFKEILGQCFLRKKGRHRTNPEDVANVWRIETSNRFDVKWIGEDTRVLTPQRPAHCKIVPAKKYADDHTITAFSRSPAETGYPPSITKFATETYLKIIDPKQKVVHIDCW